MKVNLIRTGTCRVKKRFANGRGFGFFRKINIFFDKNFEREMPVLSFYLDHEEGPFLIDTGENMDVYNYSTYPFLNSLFVKLNTEFYLKEKDMLEPQLIQTGFTPDHIKKVILTHMHQDHLGGIKLFKNIPIMGSSKEIARAKRKIAQLEGYMSNRLPKWFEPTGISFHDPGIGPFEKSHALTKDGRILVVETPGHSAGHISVIIKMNRYYIFLAGDATFFEENMKKGIVDGVAYNVKQAAESLAKMRIFCKEYPTIFLPSHDPENYIKLKKLRTAYHGYVNL